MRKLLITSFAVFFIAFVYLVFRVKEEAEKKSLIEYHKLVRVLEKKGYTYKEANYIALVEQGYRKPDSLYYVVKNKE